MPPPSSSTSLTMFSGIFLNCFVFVYLDDILIYSRDLNQHTHHVRQVLERLLENQSATLFSPWQIQEIMWLQKPQVFYPNNFLVTIFLFWAAASVFAIPLGAARWFIFQKTILAKESLFTLARYLSGASIQHRADHAGTRSWVQNRVNENKGTVL